MKITNLDFIKEVIKTYGLQEDADTLKKIINLSSVTLNFMSNLSPNDLHMVMSFLESVNSKKYNYEVLHQMIIALAGIKNGTIREILGKTFAKVNLLEHPYYDKVLEKLEKISDLNNINACIDLLCLSLLWSDGFYLEILEQLEYITKPQEEIIQIILASDVPYEYNGKSYKELIGLAKKVTDEKQKDIFIRILKSIGFIKQPKMAIKVLSLVTRTNDKLILDEIIFKYRVFYEKTEEEKTIYEEILNSLDPYRNVKSVGQLVENTVQNDDLNYLFDYLENSGEQEICCDTRVKINSTFNKRKA